MTNEEFEQHKDFILMRQAQFSLDMTELKSGLSDLRDLVARFENTRTRSQEIDRRIAALIESQMKFAEAQKRRSEELNQKFAILAAIQKRLGRESGH